MENKKNTKFENTLKDILTAKDPNSSPTSPPISRKKNYEKQKPELHQFKSNQLPKWVEILIRIAAAIIAIALLISFGLHISTR